MIFHKPGKNQTCQKRYCTLPTKAIKTDLRLKNSNLFSVKRTEGKKTNDKHLKKGKKISVLRELHGRGAKSGHREDSIRTSKEEYGA